MKLTGSQPKPDWARLLLWTPLLIGGVVAALLSTRALRLRRALRRMWFDSRGDGQMQEHLRLAIIGNDKQTIAAVFGPPRATASGNIGRTGADHDVYLAADTWYYLFDPVQQSAMVIEFDRGVARRAAFIRSPLRLASAE